MRMCNDDLCDQVKADMRERISDLEEERRLLRGANQASEERIAELEAQLKTPATITLPNAEDCAARSFVITNTGDRTINVEMAKEPSPTRAQLLAVAEAAVNAVPDDPEDRTTEDTMLLEALRAAGYLKEQGK